MLTASVPAEGRGHEEDESAQGSCSSATHAPTRECTPTRVQPRHHSPAAAAPRTSRCLAAWCAGSGGAWHAGHHARHTSHRLQVEEAGQPLALVHLGAVPARTGGTASAAGSTAGSRMRLGRDDACAVFRCWPLRRALRQPGRRLDSRQARAPWPRPQRHAPALPRIALHASACMAAPPRTRGAPCPLVSSPCGGVEELTQPLHAVVAHLLVQLKYGAVQCGARRGKKRQVRQRQKTGGQAGCQASSDRATPAGCEKLGKAGRAGKQSQARMANRVEHRAWPALGARLRAHLLGWLVAGRHALGILLCTLGASACR